MFPQEARHAKTEKKPANRVFERDFSGHFFKFPGFSRDFSLFPRFSRSFENPTVRQLRFADSVTHWRGQHRHNNTCIYEYKHIFTYTYIYTRKRVGEGQGNV